MIVLQRNPGGLPEYMSLAPDLNVGNTFVAWSPDTSQAFGFARREDAENFKKKFRHYFVGESTVTELK